MAACRQHNLLSTPSVTLTFMTCFSAVSHLHYQYDSCRMCTSIPPYFVSMEQNISCETDSFSDAEEILSIRWNPNVHIRVHNSSPLVPVLNRINRVHVPQPLSLRSILMSSFHLRLGFFSWPFCATKIRKFLA